MAKKSTHDVHPALKRGALNKPKGYTVSEADKKQARSELSKAKKNAKRGKDVPCE